MKRLDLSCLPLNLEIGETMELIDKDGKYHLLRCDMVENGNCLCDGCFFSKIANYFSCNHVKCSKREREQEVRYVELHVKNELKEEESEIKTLIFETLTETEKIKAGEKFIYVDGFNKKAKVVAKTLGLLNGQEACKRCIFNEDSCCLVSCTHWERESEDDVYYEELSFE